MKILKWQTGDESAPLMRQLVAILAQGGLVCIPCKGSYRIMADLTNEQAVTRLLQSKHRVKSAPSLVFINSRRMLYFVAANIDPVARKLADNIWPAPLTILLEANDENLDPKVVKQLSKAKGKIGVRIPDCDLSRELVDAFGKPLLVSSANREKKAGAGSPAQIRKNFMATIDLFVDAGDISGAVSSTVVDVEEGQVAVVRLGAVSEERIQEVALAESTP